jgi:hypothetical protein
VLGELTAICRSLLGGSKANKAGFVSCGLQPFYCEEGDSSFFFGGGGVRFTNFHRSCPVNGWKIFSRTMDSGVFAM